MDLLFHYKARRQLYRLGLCADGFVENLVLEGVPLSFGLKGKLSDRFLEDLLTIGSVAWLYHNLLVVMQGSPVSRAIGVIARWQLIVHFTNAR